MSPLALLKSSQWLLYAAFAASLWFGYHAWADRIGDVREAKVRADYAKQADKVNIQREAISTPIVAKEATVQTKIRTITQTIIKEVPIYVKTTDCPMPGGFRLLHDAAANGEIPNAAGIPDAASVPAQDAASTIADNYGTCKQTAARLTGLQEWVRAQADARD